MTPDLLIRGGTLLDPETGTTRAADLLIRDGTIAAIGPDLAPGDDVQSDAEIDEFIRDEGESAYHPCGTCAMGDGEGGVVDAEGRVHGVAGLRVVDASIMPTIPSGNLNAPVIMMAEKLADAIRGRDPLPPEDPPVWVHPDWQTTQR